MAEPRKVARVVSHGPMIYDRTFSELPRVEMLLVTEDEAHLRVGTRLQVDATDWPGLDAALTVVEWLRKPQPCSHAPDGGVDGWCHSVVVTIDQGQGSALANETIQIPPKPTPRELGEKLAADSGYPGQLSRVMRCSRFGGPGHRIVTATIEKAERPGEIEPGELIYLHPTHQLVRAVRMTYPFAPLPEGRWITDFEHTSVKPPPLDRSGLLTTHELAAMLLAGADVPIKLVSDGGDYHYGVQIVERAGTAAQWLTGVSTEYGEIELCQLDIHAVPD